MSTPIYTVSIPFERNGTIGVRRAEVIFPSGNPRGQPVLVLAWGVDAKGRRYPSTVEPLDAQFLNKVTGFLTDYVYTGTVTGLVDC